MRNRVSRAQRKSGDAAVVSCVMWRSHLRLVSCVLLNALLRYSNALTIQRLSQRMRVARPASALRLEPQLRQSESRIRFLQHLLHPPPAWHFIKVSFVVWVSYEAGTSLPT
jgi:hypothetical protein